MAHEDKSVKHIFVLLFELNCGLGNVKHAGYIFSQWTVLGFNMPRFLLASCFTIVHPPPGV